MLHQLLCTVFRAALRLPDAAACGKGGDLMQQAAAVSAFRVLRRLLQHPDMKSRDALCRWGPASA